MRPQPIWPTVMRLFEPNAREGTNIGAVAAVSAADLIRSRRVMVMANPAGELRSREYIRVTRALTMRFFPLVAIRTGGRRSDRAGTPCGPDRCRTRCQRRR